MKNKPDNHIVPSAEIAALRSGLDELKEKLTTKDCVSIRYGRRGSRPGRTRTQLELTETERKQLQTIGHAISLAVGRKATRALVVRLALSNLVKHCAAALSDPAGLPKLRAEVTAIREGRVQEIEEIAR